ncbi:hypothetical protein K438DRAFT_1812679 [Mycena galopus ATCC 62051]|nr:hypothetical protein K438DRAFT_1812679 [Mycena galopus ATCC 62051]
MSQPSSSHTCACCSSFCTPVPATYCRHPNTHSHRHCGWTSPTTFCSSPSWMLYPPVASPLLPLSTSLPNSRHHEHGSENGAFLDPGSDMKYSHSHYHSHPRSEHGNGGLDTHSKHPYISQLHGSFQGLPEPQYSYPSRANSYNRSPSSSRPLLGAGSRDSPSSYMHHFEPLPRLTRNNDTDAKFRVAGGYPAQPTYGSRPRSRRRRNTNPLPGPSEGKYNRKRAQTNGETDRMGKPFLDDHAVNEQFAQDGKSAAPKLEVDASISASSESNESGTNLGPDTPRIAAGVGSQPNIQWNVSSISGGTGGNGGHGIAGGKGGKGGIGMGPILGNTFYFKFH